MLRTRLRTLSAAGALISAALIGVQLPAAVVDASPVVVGHPGMGYLWNFDTTNSTDRSCQGFEIQIDGVTAADVAGTYWGTYNQPTVTDATFNGTAGIDVVYSATYDSNTSLWSVETPVSGLEHFGVSLNVAPGMQRYTWLCDNPSNPGHLSQYGGTTEGNGYPMPVDPSLVMTAGTTVPTVAAGATLGATPVQTAVTQALVNNAPQAAGNRAADAFFACHFELTTNQQITLGDLLTDSNLVKATLSGHQVLDQCDLINGGQTYTMPSANLSDDKGVTNSVYLFEYTGTYDDAHTPNCTESPTAADYCANDLGTSIGVDMIANTSNNRGLGVQVQGGGVVTTNQLNLVATPNPGYVFTGWQTKLHAGSEGTCKNATTSCSMTLSKNVNLVAAFALAPSISVSTLSTTSFTRGKVATTTVTGKLFTKGVRISFSGTGVSGVVTYKSATSLSVKVTVTKTAPKGKRTVTFTNPNGTTATYTAGVTIK